MFMYMRLYVCVCAIRVTYSIDQIDNKNCIQFSKKKLLCLMKRQISQVI